MYSDQDLKLDTEFAHVVGDVFVRLSANTPGAADVEIRWGDQSVVESQFADWGSVRAISTGDNCVFLLGLDRLIHVQAPAGPKAILQLRRDERYNPGFKYEHVLRISGGFVVMHESGVARVSDDGTVLWERDLEWFDQFIRLHREYLEFAREHPADFRIDIRDGTESPLNAAQ